MDLARADEAPPAGSPQGASPEEMRAGGADAHATLALRAMSAASSDETTP
jgi:hypothetical protein